MSDIGSQWVRLSLAVVTSVPSPLLLPRVRLGCARGFLPCRMLQRWFSLCSNTRAPSHLWVNAFCSSPTPAAPVRPQTVFDALTTSPKLWGGPLLQPQHFQSGPGSRKRHGAVLEDAELAGMRSWNWLGQEAGIGWNEKLELVKPRSWNWLCQEAGIG